MALREVQPLFSEAASVRSPCQPRSAPGRAGWALRAPRHLMLRSLPPRTTAVWFEASPYNYHLRALQAP